MNKIAIAIGVGVFVVTVVACCFCWGLWKLRHRMRATGQISATPEELLVESQKGVQEDVKVIIPTTIASNSTKSQCRICLLEFRIDEDVRKLPLCGHMFHNRCINPVLRIRQTCPICSSRVGSEKEPPWILVNKPVPLPRTAVVTSASSSERFEIELTNSTSSKGESPLLKHQDDDDDDECVDISFAFSTDIPVEKRQQIYNAKTFDHSLSFSFPATAAPATRHSRSSSGYGGEHVPLTKSPQHCSFEVLPVFTSPAPARKVGSHRSSYSQL